MADSPPEIHSEIEKLERRHAENPEGRFFVPLANAYRKLGDVENAEALLREGLRRHPDYLSAHIVLGRALADRGATAEAAEEFRYVLSLDPQNLIALRTLGELAAAEGREDEAGRWYEELLDVDPMNEEARQALDSLRSRPSAAEGDEGEFRAGAGWWEPAAEAEAGDAEAADEQPFAPTDQEGFALAGPGAAPGETADDLAGDEAGPVEVVTETIAELYARQGFHDRAADVYRELIRRRGGDPTLERRLAEVELAAATSNSELTLEPESEPITLVPAAATDAFDDPFAGSFSGGFIDLGEDADAAPPADESPQEAPVLEVDRAGEEEAEEIGAEQAVEEIGAVQSAPSSPPLVPAGGAGTVGAYLESLLSWRPGSGASPADGASPAAEPVPAMEIEPEAEPEPVEFEPVEPEPLPELRAQSEAATTAEEPVRPEPVGAEPADDEPFPWELPTATTDVEPPPREELLTYDALFAPDAAPVSEADSAPAAEPPPQEEASPAAADEDDDLESFQAWLRSLKR